MSDKNPTNEGFIPFNQSTPIHQGGRQWNNRQGSFHNQRFSFSPGNNKSGYNRRWNNKSRGNSSFESDCSNSFKQDINAYLHPCMLQDPWAQLRQQMNLYKNN